MDETCSYEFTRLPSTMLESDTTTSAIDLKRVGRIVKFRCRLVNPLKVSSGTYYVFDGAHAGRAEVNKFDNFMVDCMLFHGHL